jgi:hypothetical protein
MIQGRTVCKRPPPTARTLTPGDIIRSPDPACIYLDGYHLEATRLAEAALRLSPARHRRDRLEHGRDALTALDAHGGDLSGYVRRVWADFATLLPEQAAMTLATTRPNTRPHLIDGTGWTGFVLNRDVTLNYHQDTANTPGWTAILAMRHNAQGGWLHLPDHDVWLPMDHGTVAVFPGLTTWHGVSPVDLDPDGFRFTLVTYPRRFVPRRADRQRLG